MSVNSLPHEVLPEIFQLLTTVTSRAYCPYSTFQVGCVIKLQDGTLIPGCNVENASFSLTICAERAAIASAISQGYKKQDMVEFYVITKLNQLVFPCGACRCAIAEMNPSAKVIVVSCDGTQTTSASIAELLPNSFSIDDLEAFKKLCNN